MRYLTYEGDGWTDELRSIRAELEEKGELLRREGYLDHGHRYDKLVTVHVLSGPDWAGAVLSPPQEDALTSLARTLGDRALIHNNTIVTLKPEDERLWRVCEEERKRRESEAEKAQA